MLAIDLVNEEAFFQAVVGLMVQSGFGLYRQTIYRICFSKQGFHGWLRGPLPSAPTRQGAPAFSLCLRPFAFMFEAMKLTSPPLRSKTST